MAISTSPHHARLRNGVQLTDSLRVSPGRRRPAPNVLGVGRRVQQFPLGQDALGRDGAQSGNVWSHDDGAVVVKDWREKGAWGRCVAAWDLWPYHNSHRRRRMPWSNVGDSYALSAGKGCRVWLWVGLALWGLLLMGNPRKIVAAGRADGAQVGRLLYARPHKQSPISDSRCTQVKAVGEVGCRCKRKLMRSCGTLLLFSDRIGPTWQLLAPVHDGCARPSIALSAWRRSWLLEFAKP